MDQRPSGQSLMARLLATIREDGPGTHRIQDILSTPFRGRHITNFVSGGGMVDGIPLFDAMIYWRIQQEGLRISTGGTAKYGDGAYCFAGNVKPPASHHFYLDLEIPAGNAVEQISVPGISLHYYRFLPAQGDVIKGVKITGTNLPPDALDRAREFIKSV